MKILQVTNFFKPSWETGGPARVAYEISKKLTERGHEVTVYTTDGFKSRLDVKTNKPVDVDGIKTYYFRNLFSYLAREMVLPIPYYLPMVASREIRDFDVIHVHEYRTVLAIVVRYYAKKYGIPYVLQAHGSLPIIIKRQRLKKIFDLFFGYKILRDASKVIALTKTEVGDYKKMGVDDDKIEIVPNGIDLSEYGSLPERGKFRRKYGIKDNEEVILYIGRLHRTKGIDLLVKAFANISKELDNVKLVIVGPDDGYRSALEELMQALKVDDKVLCTGFVSNDEKMAALTDADVFVNPRADEIFGLVFLEANACGTPVICSKGCGIANVIDGKTGFAVHNDKDQLRDAISKILSDEGLRRRFGEEGRRLVEERFNWDMVIRSIERLYEKTINGVL